MTFAARLDALVSDADAVLVAAVSLRLHAESYTRVVGQMLQPDTATSVATP